MAAFLRKYAAATTLNFPLISFNSVSFTSTASLTTADSKVSLNEGAFTTTVNAVVNEGSYGYSYTCTTADMTAARIVLVIVNTAATKTFEDTMILVETYGHASAQHPFDLSVVNQTVIASAGTVMLAASALSAGAVVAGALSAGAFGAGFISAGGIATGAIDADALADDAVTEIWSKAAVEPAGVPAVTASMVDALSWMLVLSRNKITQTATLQTLLADNTAATIAASTISDDGTTFIRGEFA